MTALLLIAVGVVVSLAGFLYLAWQDRRYRETVGLLCLRRGEGQNLPALRAIEARQYLGCLVVLLGLLLSVVAASLVEVP